MSDQALNSGDSAELEALFDSILATSQGNDSAPPASPEFTTTVSTPAPATQEAVAEPAAPSVEMSPSNEGDQLAEPAKSMFSHIGQLTRKLHDTLRQLGLDKSLEQAASQIPDARDRLSYIATMTEQAAERTLNALDVAKPLQDRISNDSAQLAAEWERLFANQLSVDEFKQLAERTKAFLNMAHADSEKINSQMLEIMMAQDFQDLTGQVIKKVLGMAKEMEQQLLDFLLMFSPQGVKQDDGSLLNGPVVKAEGRTDIVTNQAQVDDLLESLGF
ncbi:protein phosphatase CheZ [Chitinilyticum piscinae]|uniref:Protein phosphatase CheZ n=1 Tax=Chitinilyticum piscinae TaxID=2866724 RepID=A0A8J7K2L3_9NEIS|nr:protein phosphatase CheZ [Chitinilyticum piscinae]MBE9610192.1 protein phosphatase CheZ [Chitinilyticum piscinae]